MILDRIKDFFTATPETPAEAPPARNELCHCGSGKKYKKCCLRKDQRK